MAKPETTQSSRARIAEYEEAYGCWGYLLFELESERDRYKEALHTIAADTLDHETVRAALAWRQKLAHEVLKDGVDG